MKPVSPQPDKSKVSQTAAKPTLGEHEVDQGKGKGRAQDAQTSKTTKPLEDYVAGDLPKAPELPQKKSVAQTESAAQVTSLPEGKDSEKLADIAQKMKKVVDDYKKEVGNAMNMKNIDKRNSALSDITSRFSTALEGAYKDITKTDFETQFRAIQNAPEPSFDQPGFFLQLQQDHRARRNDLALLVTLMFKVFKGSDSTVKGVIAWEGPHSALMPGAHLSSFDKDIEPIVKFLPQAALSGKKEEPTPMSIMLQCGRDVFEMQEKYAAISGLEVFEKDNNNIVITFKLLTAIFAITVVGGLIFGALWAHYQGKHDSAEKALNTLKNDLRAQSKPTLRTE